MKNILIVEVWQHRSSALATLATIFIVFLWPSIPLGGVTVWLQFLYYYAPQNYFYTLLAILAGLNVGIYVYNKRVVSCCSIKSAKAGATASFFGTLLGACPACIPALAFLLPLSVTIVFSRVNLFFLLVSIGVMLFAIYRMNGFRKFSG